MTEWGLSARAQPGTYGPDAPTETELRLLGPVEGRRVLVLGAGDGSSAVTLQGLGAKVIVVETSLESLARAQAAWQAADVLVEAHQADLGALAFLRSESIDAALAPWSLAEVDDLGRVFRQVHRVLRQGAPLALSIPHPTRVLHAGGRYGDRHTVTDVFTALTRASFRVDVLLEPPGPAGSTTPAALVVRARKEGN